MSDGTKISWSDATWNPLTGCTRVSEGCDHCYIERTPPFRMEGRRFDKSGIGGTTGVRLHPDRLDQPLRWRKPRRVFVNSLSDLFHTDVPDDYIARVFAVMAMSPRHTFQVLTKRPARMRSLLSSDDFQSDVAGFVADHFEWPNFPRPGIDVTNTWPLGNVWVGVSAESQKWADLRIPDLLATPAAVRWVSAEPLLGPLDLSAYLADELPVTDDYHDAPDGAMVFGMERVGDYWKRREGLSWLVAGGESGPGARPMHPDWARSLRDQCVDAGVAYHFKQWGEWAPFGTPSYDTDRTMNLLPDGSEYTPDRLAQFSDAAMMVRTGKKVAGRMLDGRSWDEYPEVTS